MIKKLILSFFLLTCIYAQTAVVPSAGDGSESNPYQIASLENLYWISADSSNWDKHYIQTADISLSECQNWDYSTEDIVHYGWKPIGTEACPFTGSYNGQYHIIDSLIISTGDCDKLDDQGLFGRINHAQIEKILLTNVNVYVSYNSFNTGALIGYCDSSYVSQCSFGGYVHGCFYTAGLIGYLNHSIVNQCCTGGRIYAINTSGGIVAYLDNSVISNSYCKAYVISEGRADPIAYTEIDTSIVKCYCTIYGEGLGDYYGTKGISSFCLSHNYPTDVSFHFYNMYNNHKKDEMKNPDTYLNAGWDFVIETENGTEDIWDIDTSGAINNGYPFLHWEHPERTYFTSINDIQVPENYQLYQNYPNPFNPITTISYNLPESQNITLQIFDIKGCLVETLHNGYKEAGHWDVTWDAGDLSSGLYIYRLEAGDLYVSRKMVLMK